jgi:hypothetical protein
VAYVGREDDGYACDDLGVENSREVGVLREFEFDAVVLSNFNLVVIEELDEALGGGGALDAPQRVVGRREVEASEDLGKNEKSACVLDRSGVCVRGIMQEMTWGVGGGQTGRDLPLVRPRCAQCRCSPRLHR